MIISKTYLMIISKVYSIDKENKIMKNGKKNTLYIFCINNI